MRIPLIPDTKPRSSSERTKGSLLKNAFVESTPSGINISIKRPGIYLGAAGAGAASTSNGLFLWNNTIYWWDGVLGMGLYGNGDALVPTQTPLNLIGGTYWFNSAWSSSTSYLITNPLTDPGIVAQDPADGIWKIFYIIIESTNVAPSTVVNSIGSTYWSVVRPTSSIRYMADYLGSYGGVSTSAYGAGYDAYSRYCAFKSCATQYIPTGFWGTFAGVGTYGVDHVTLRLLVHQYASDSGCTGTTDSGIAPYGYVYPF